MVTQTAGRGLSTEDLTKIRDTLAAGRKPRVMFTEAAGQIAGQVGQVVQLTDPAVSDEWVVVRFGNDELPFSPTDLVVPPRGSASRVTPSRVTPSKEAGRRSSVASLPSPREETPVPPSPTPPSAAPAKSATAVDGAGPKKAAAATKAAAAPAAKAAAEPVKAAPAPATEAAAVDPAGDGRAEKRAPARKAAKPKPPPSLTVTLAYAEGEWMVGATQGSKTLAKPYLIKPAEALKMISMLDVPGVREAVEDIVSAARQEAERQAERLRAELADVESRLAELRDAG
jgi:hypothetical protein